jgi:uncharacterized membrane protein YfcA
VDQLGLSGSELGLAAGILLLASYVRGYSGFGFSAVLVAGLTNIIEPAAAVPLAIAFEVLASVVQGRSIWDEIRWKDAALLLGAAIIGNPIGVLLLNNADADALRVGTFILLGILSTALLASRKKGALVPTPGLIFGVGVVAGVVNGATAMSGLVLVLAMSFVVITKEEMRGTLVAYFFASDLVVIGFLGATGELNSQLGWRTLLGIPILASGVWLGSHSFRGTSDETFRRATLGLLVGLSVFGLARLIY